MFKETNFSKNIFFGFFHKVFFCKIFYCVAELFTETWYSLMLKQNIGIVNDVIFSSCYMHAHETNTFGNFDSFSESFSKFALREFHKNPFTLEVLDHYMMLKVQNENLLKKKCEKRPGPDPPPKCGIFHTYFLFFMGSLTHSYLFLSKHMLTHSQMHGQ